MAERNDPGPADGDWLAVIVDELALAGLSKQTVSRLTGVAERFRQFALPAHGVRHLGDVTPQIAAGFVRAPTISGPPGPNTMHFRRWVLRVLFRTARQLGLIAIEPTLDLELPARDGQKLRPLTDDEIAVCHSFSICSLNETRLPAALALAEATGRTSEIGFVRARDVDLAAGTVILSAGSRTPRLAELSEWGRTQLDRRLGALRRTDGAPDAFLIYSGRGSDVSRQAAACTTLRRIFELAQLGDDPAVRPLSIVAWAGRRMLDETGRIDGVARRLGMRSIDATADLIGWDWQKADVD